MKQLFTLAAVAATILTATSCSEKETDGLQIPGSGQGVALGINTGVQATATKAVVEGTKITYTDADYATEASGLGLILLNTAGTGFYTPENTADYAAGAPVWFMGNATGLSWKAISAKGASFNGATASSYYLTNLVGRVYAWYPYNPGVAVTGNTEGTLTLPIRVEATGAIDATTNNADMIHTGVGATGWVANSTGVTPPSAQIVAAATEIDYLFFNGGSDGGSAIARYVNNGRVGTAGPTGLNTDATNPGFEVTMAMNHAMSMVSFRVYSDGTLGGALNLEQIKLENHTGTPLNFGTAGMSLATGVISNFAAGAATDITRTITNYTLASEVPAGTTQDATHFIETGGVTGKTVSKKVSTVVYPAALNATNVVLATITIDGTDYMVELPTDPSWLAGQNTIYTICASRRALQVVDVNVVQWETEDGGEIEI